MVKRKILIFDYGCGNILSISKAFKYLGANVEVASSRRQVMGADLCVLPGVGSFSTAKDFLDRGDGSAYLHDRVANNGRVLGICLGMQLLFSRSEEAPSETGLDYINGSVERLSSLVENSSVNVSIAKVPNTGWRRVKASNAGVLSKLIDSQYFYFNHSYHVVAASEAILGVSSFGNRDICACAATGNVLGFQFHPEKSGEVGLALLEAVMSESWHEG